MQGVAAEMFETRKFLIDNFSNAKGLTAFLEAYGAPIPLDAAVQKWFQRASIPSSWLPVLIAYLEIEHAKPISLIPYLGARK